MPSWTIMADKNPKKTGGYIFREISKEEYYALQNKTSN